RRPLEGELAFVASGASAWCAALEGKPPAAIRFDVPVPDAPEVTLEPATSELSGPGELVFVARVPVPDSPATRPLPKRVAIVLDASSSSSGRDRAKERAFVEAYLARLGS